MYVECWFEASAMEAQFDYYTNENIPLLAFRGDVSIPEKWKAAERLALRWAELHKPIIIYYFGDLDPKGLTIPESAWVDIRLWARALVQNYTPGDSRKFREGLAFRRVGLSPGDERIYSLPENPERPGTYQWEALSDEQARDLIEQANAELDLGAFEEMEAKEQAAAAKVREHLEELEL